MMRLVKIGSWCTAFAVFVLAPLAASFPGAAAAEGVAVITDLVGKVSNPSAAAHRLLTILSDIDAGTRLQLDSGARLVVLYTSSGDEYAFSGPALIQFNASAPSAVSGANPQKQANRAGAVTGIRIKPATTQAVFVMRSARAAARIKLLTLTGTRTLETSPQFRWRGEPGAKYRFELSDDTGKSLFEAQVEGNALKLPPAIELAEGVGYSWTLASLLDGGRRYSSSGDFSLARAGLRERAEAMRPPDAAAVSERVAYAAWLEQMELRDEARRYWRTLAAERPQDTRLKELAAE